MEPLFRRLRSEVSEVEAQYRQHYLRSDVRQLITLVFLWALAYTGFAYTDYLFFDLNSVFYRLLATRLIYILFCLLVIILLEVYVHSYTVFDRLAIAWAGCSVVVSMLVTLTQPSDYLVGMLIDLVGVFGFYVFLPGRFVFRLLPPLAYSAFAVIWVIRGFPGLSPEILYTMGFSYIMTNVMGVLFSSRLYSSRRKEFIAHLEDERNRAELQRLASTDPLTGVLNRRSLLGLAEEAFYRFRRYRRPFTILVMDLDGFKTVNDMLGHNQGDHLLIEFAQQVAREKRTIDGLGRMGGDEFCLVLPETLTGDACSLAERILTACRDLKATDGTESVAVTVSIGITQVRADDITLDAIFARADRALYNSKHDGRDRWAVA